MSESTTFVADLGPYDPEFRTECCQAVVTYSDAFGAGAVLVCKACFKEVCE